MGEVRYCYVGTYTRPILFGTGEILDGKGEGIYLVKLEMETGQLTLEGLAAEAENPSYLCLDGTGNCLYAVNELKEYEGQASGAVSAYSVNPMTGALTLMNQKPSGGQDPCHLALTESGETLVVSNFMTGSVCAWHVGELGLKEAAGFFQHEGRGSHPVRQKGPHAHSCIVIEGSGCLIVPDLGIDQLVAYEVKEDGNLTPKPESSFQCQPGSGPRFGQYLQESGRLYVINELASSISLFQWEEGSQKLTHVQTVSTILELQNPCDNICADLHLTPDGRFLYASNRGHDSIAVYAVDGETGRLIWADQVSCGGRTPRNFAIEPDGRYLLCGNQDTDQIVVFEINRETGYLTECSRLKIPVPVCILPVP